ncbi:HPr family phosphocarrier protein [Ectobacillus funiculus]|uniref:HPr family phosphocarrier protein n=1 Tax=Ectobacillus funiculus TaxID=137993 RepID=UPI00397D4DAE
MIEEKIVVCLPNGLQARIATEFVHRAAAFSSEIKLGKNGRAVDCKSIMGVMSLAIREGEAITIIANGRDEQAAIVALGEFLSGKK